MKKRYAVSKRRFYHSYRSIFPFYTVSKAICHHTADLKTQTFDKSFSVYLIANLVCLQQALRKRAADRRSLSRTGRGWSERRRESAARARPLPTSNLIRRTGCGGTAGSEHAEEGFTKKDRQTGLQKI